MEHGDHHHHHADDHTHHNANKCGKSKVLSSIDENDVWLVYECQVSVSKKESKSKMKAEKWGKLKAKGKSLPARALDMGRKKNKKDKKDKKNKKKGKSTGKQARVLKFILFMIFMIFRVFHDFSLKFHNFITPMKVMQSSMCC